MFEKTTPGQDLHNSLATARESMVLCVLGEHQWGTII